MKFKHIETGYEITGETIKELLGNGDIINFHKPVSPTSFDRIPLQIPYYTYNLRDIPFNADWEEIPEGVNLTMSEMENVMWFLRFNAPQDDEHIASAVTKLHKSFNRLRDLKLSNKLLGGI